MTRILFSFITVLIFSISFSSHASTALQGYGAFNQLNKDWMLIALYNKVPASIGEPESSQRLDIKIATEKFSPRRFRSMWLEALVIEHGTDKVAAMHFELQQFFDILQGPLRAGDNLIIERTENGADVKINSHSFVHLSGEFLDALVASLVGKHPPTQALKTGLSGHASIQEQASLSMRFDLLIPSEQRIMEVSSWKQRILASN